MFQIEKDSLLFTVGPTELDPEVLEWGAKPLPYFRTDEFSEMMLSLERDMLSLLEAPQASRLVTLTSSGTGAMEAAVVNLFDRSSKVLVVAGGAFGQRFVDLCAAFEIPHEVLRLRLGEAISPAALDAHRGRGFTGVLINALETSTGVLHDMKHVHQFCREENALLVCDAISTFLADDFHMSAWGIDATIISSQKAIALPPGISCLALGSRAIRRIQGRRTGGAFYFDLKKYLADGVRGQTPFTPAVGILVQMAARLERMKERGPRFSIERCEELARDFRKGIAGLPLEVCSESLSNAVTPLRPLNGRSAHEIYLRLKKDFGITVLPSGGELKDVLFRVGHLGNLTIQDNRRLVGALTEILSKGIQ